MDEILAEAGIKTVLTGIRMPRMNSIMERRVQSRRRCALTPIRSRTQSESPT